MEQYQKENNEIDKQLENINSMIDKMYIDLKTKISMGKSENIDWSKEEVIDMQRRMLESPQYKHLIELGEKLIAIKPALSIYLRR